MSAPINVEVGMSASASSGNAARLGNYSVVGGGGSVGGGSSRQQMILQIILAAMALIAFIVWMKRK